MNQFDWKSRLEGIYKTFPEAGKQPIIGITGNFGDKGCELARGYYQSVIRSGGCADDYSTYDGYPGHD